MAVASRQSTLITAAQLAEPGMPEKFVELIEGELILMTPAGKWHNRVAMNLAFAFRQFCAARPDLDFGGDNEGFLIHRDPDTVLSPDACLFRARPDTGSTWMEFAPELVVEVLSPANSQAEMAFKRQRFFDAGTEQFWLIDRETQTLHLYHRDGRIETYPHDAIFQGEGIADGLQLSLADLFQQH